MDTQAKFWKEEMAKYLTGRSDGTARCVVRTLKDGTKVSKVVYLHAGWVKKAKRVKLEGDSDWWDILTKDFDHED